MAIPTQAVIDQFAALSLEGKIALVLTALLPDNFEGTSYYSTGLLFSHTDIYVRVQTTGSGGDDTKLTFIALSVKNSTDWTNVQNACSAFRSIVSTTGGGSSWTTATVTINFNLSPNHGFLNLTPGDDSYRDALANNTHNGDFVSVFGSNLTAII